MAFAVSLITQSVFGNLRVLFHQVTPDSAEGSITLSNRPLIWAMVSERKRATFVASGNTAQSYVNYVLNAGTTGTVAAGALGLSGCVANNIMHVVSYTSS